jgi:dipeptidyl aminopeptidase/acylaminoacyl peptidase
MMALVNVSPRRAAPVALLLLLAMAAATPAAAQGTKADYERAEKLRSLTQNKVFRARIQPHWEAGNNGFWYRNDLAEGKREFIRVDAVKGTRAPAFDHAKIAAALQKALGKPVAADKLPVDNLQFQLDSTTLLLTVRGKTWECNLADYSLKERTDVAPVSFSLPDIGWPRPSRSGGDQTEIVFDNRTQQDVQLFWIDTNGERQPYGTIKAGERRNLNTYAGHVWLVQNADGRPLGVYEATDSPGTAVIGERRRRGEFAPEDFGPPPDTGNSPDGKRYAFVKGFNVWLRDKASKQETQLTSDGQAKDAYADLYWSPDSTRLVAMKVLAGDDHKVYFVESSPRDQLQPKLHSMDYLKPGDRVPQPKPHLFVIATGKEIPISEALYPNSYDLGEVRWASDSSRFTFLYNQRGHQVLRVVSVDAATGAAKTIVDEKSDTFIDYSGKYYCEFLDASSELVWMSERDGWCHLYLYDSKTGEVKNQITKGNWVVRGVDKVDPAARRIWFRAGGLDPAQDPYYIHYCRINFDGTGLVDLTPGDGTHSMTPSPDGRFYIDSYSRVDMPPVNELRRADDGKLVCELEKGDAKALLAAGWKMPEHFVAKGRDGKTDIYGVIWRPTNLRPNRKYPVIEDIYAGPQDSYTPKAWSSFFYGQELAELGFIVVQLDGMGTSNRSKAFHDVCWKNLADAGFPDRILWMKAAAAKYPYMDVSRVGIFGGSAGGQNALGALLFHPDFYKVGIADSGCHDNRMDKIWWNEQWMGWPIGPQYAACSNAVNAYRLQGKLFLIEGEMDTNVDPASTMQVVNALIKANKDFDLLVVPGGGHCPGGSPYGERRQHDFFVRNLLGVEPRSK